MTKSPLTSIRVSAPLETGGSVARSGFEYQDHVAVMFILRLLDPDNPLLEVWCETQDDITLIAHDGLSETAEFVQVKNVSRDHLWSVAELCKKESVKAPKTSDREGSEATPAKPPKSILQKSLENDRFSEPAYFRIVSSRDVNGDLSPLKLAFEAPGRVAAKTVDLVEALTTKLGDFESANNNGAEFWVSRCQWEVHQDSTSLENANLIKLEQVLKDRGIFLAPDQRQELYLKLLRAAQLAGERKWDEGPEQKKFVRREFGEVFDGLVERIQNPESDPTGSALERKMRDAELNVESIRSAVELRRTFKMELITPSFLDTGLRERLISEVIARLNSVRAKLDSGELQDNGPEFHARCLDSLNDISEILGIEEKVPFSYLQGSMYEITNRCLHRFSKVKL